MKHLLTAFLLLFLFAACHSDDEEITDSGNVNRNDISLYPDAARLEFPKLKTENSVLIVHRTGGEVNYSVEWDYNLKSQRWSCYTLNRQSLEQHTTRYYGNPQYPLDPDLPAQYYFDRPSADYTTGDYFYGSGFDHGHICPSADRLYSKEANYQTFYLTNMQPQYKEFNAGLWANMEGQVRQWAKSYNTEMLYVCKGTTIDSEMNIIKRIQGKLIVPKYFYMALLLKTAYGYRAIAFWAENEKVDRDGDKLSKYAISIDELERRTSIDFFCNLPDDIEDEVEAAFSPNAWGF
ncbi:MAG: DNA/RNA non-specific endonuclease [Prevotella sp.]|nr:DNA/RNA non-specific endonuclease [Prevotella sp.]